MSSAAFVTRATISTEEEASVREGADQFDDSHIYIDIYLTRNCFFKKKKSFSYKMFKH